MKDPRKGFMSMVGACVIWGNFSLLFYALKNVAAFDVVAYRAIFGLLTLLLWLAYCGRLAEIKATLRVPQNRNYLLLSTLFITINWLVFVWAVQNNQALEASIGYFIFPLVSVALAAIVKGERLNRFEYIAVVIAFIAIVILTVGLAVVPVVSLVLAMSFSLYGLVKSYTNVGSVISITVETLIFTPVGIVYLLWSGGWQAVIFSGLDAVYLVLAGIFTAISLILFATATRNLKFSSVGMLLFLNPIIQVCVAAFILAEPVSLWHKIAIALISIAGMFYVMGLKSTRQE